MFDALVSASVEEVRLSSDCNWEKISLFIGLNESLFMSFFSNVADFCFH